MIQADRFILILIPVGPAENYRNVILAQSGCNGRRLEYVATRSRLRLVSCSQVAPQGTVVMWGSAGESVIAWAVAPGASERPRAARESGSSAAPASSTDGRSAQPPSRGSDRTT